MIIPLSVKCFLNMFTFFIFLCGFIIMGVGIWSAVGTNPFKSILSINPLIFDTTYLMIAVGVILFVTAILGFCAVANDNRCLLKLYFVVIFLVFVMQLTGSIMLFVQLPRATQVAKDSMLRYNQTTEAGRNTKQGWDSFQQLHQCCGYDEHDDWASLPASCCTGELSNKIKENGQCLNINSNKKWVYKHGCRRSLSNYIWAIAGIGIGFIVFLVITMILTARFYRKLKYAPSETEVKA